MIVWWISELISSLSYFKFYWIPYSPYNNLVLVKKIKFLLEFKIILIYLIIALLFLILIKFVPKL